jgi:cytochrome c553
MTPSVDVAYADVWTDATAAGRAKDASFAYKYSDIATIFTTAGATFTPPVSSACQTTWTAKCRTVINYVTNIQQIWNLTRGDSATDNDTAADTCVSCHTTNGNTQVPAGNTQLDLTDSVSDQNADHLTSYRELFFPDNKQVLNGNVLQDELVDSGNVDALGNPIYVNVSIGPVMSTAGANANTTFFNLFAPGGTHAGRLSAAELRLISEWLDIGAQYYNNPFDAP